MIHAYHVIWGTYGFWLPNDPRGSWSEFVASWELARFGQATKSAVRLPVEYTQWKTWRKAAEKALKFPSVHLSGNQALAVAEGFRRGVEKSRFTILACSILPQHVHLVLARHHFRAEQICNLLKGESTRQLKDSDLHPQSKFSRNGRTPQVWAKKQWINNLDNEEAVETAIRYVDDNPEKEGRRKQRWSFIVRFEGVPRYGWTTYH